MDFQEIEGQRKGSVVFRDENGFEYSKNTASDKTIHVRYVKNGILEKSLHQIDSCVPICSGKSDVSSKTT